MLPASLTNEQMTELVGQYGDEMLRLALLYLGSREQAEDAVQDSFVKIYKTGNAEKICKTFMMRVLVNTCKDYKKCGWSKNVSLADQLPDVAAEDNPTNNASGALREAILLLPQKYRNVIILRYYEDMAVGDIATVLGVPQPTVSIRLKRACAKLQKGLEGIPREDL